MCRQCFRLIIAKFVLINCITLSAVESTGHQRSNSICAAAANTTKLQLCVYNLSQLEKVEPCHRCKPLLTSCLSQSDDRLVWI